MMRTSRGVEAWGEMSCRGGYLGDGRGERSEGMEGDGVGRTGVDDMEDWLNGLLAGWLSDCPIMPSVVFPFWVCRACISGTDFYLSFTLPPYFLSSISSVQTMFCALLAASPCGAEAQVHREELFLMLKEGIKRLRCLARLIR
jgi:hypothetical protein